MCRPKLSDGAAMHLRERDHHEREQQDDAREEAQLEALAAGDPAPRDAQPQPGEQQVGQLRRRDRRERVDDPERRGDEEQREDRDLRAPAARDPGRHAGGHREHEQRLRHDALGERERERQGDDAARRPDHLARERAAQQQEPEHERGGHTEHDRVRVDVRHEERSPGDDGGGCRRPAQRSLRAFPCHDAEAPVRRRGAPPIARGSSVAWDE